jgi:hypothetical protein
MFVKYTHDVYVRSPNEEECVELAYRAIEAYRRASVLRRLAIGSLVAMTITRVAYHWATGAPNDALFNSPVVWGFTFYASFFTFALEWSTGAECKAALRRCPAELGADG